jgi:hypothetical protein
VLDSLLSGARTCPALPPKNGVVTWFVAEMRSAPEIATSPLAPVYTHAPEPTVTDAGIGRDQVEEENWHTHVEHCINIIMDLECAYLQLAKQLDNGLLVLLYHKGSSTVYVAIYSQGAVVYCGIWHFRGRLFF